MNRPRTLCTLVPAVLLAIACVLPMRAQARTLVIGISSSNRVAMIAASAPRLSWAGYHYPPAIYGTGTYSLMPQMSLLLQFPLDAVPAGQRIVHAELLVPASTPYGTDPRFYVWRILADWGPGVCHLYRMTRPHRVEWAKPGARAHGLDRAIRPTDIVSVVKAGEHVVNVTEDVQLWYTGTAANNGWILTVEDPETQINMASTTWSGAEGWKLRVTYEPIPDGVPRADER